MTPASNSTYVIEVNPESSKGYTLTPVVGWEIEDNRPLPVTLNGRHTLIADGVAVVFPCGMVEHPSYGVAFDNIEAWLESNPSHPKKHPESATAEAPRKPPKAPSGKTPRTSAFDIEWTTDSFKNNSFWHYDDGDNEFVFQIDGGTPLPKATKAVTKIKRSDFMEAKKSVDALTVEDIKNADPLEVASDDDDEDDDAEDLI